MEEAKWMILVFPIKDTVPIVCPENLVSYIKAIHYEKHKIHPTHIHSTEDCWLAPTIPNYDSPAYTIIVSNSKELYKFRMKIEAYSTVVECMNNTSSSPAITGIPFNEYLLVLQPEIAQALRENLTTNSNEMLKAEQDFLASLGNDRLRKTVILPKQSIEA